MTNLPKPLVAEGQFVDLCDELLTIASRHPGLGQAVQTILAATVKTDQTAEMLIAMQPLAEQLRKIAELDRWLGQVPSNLSEEEIHRKLKARRMGERDTAINALLSQAKAIVKALATEAVPKRNRRYYKQMKELVGQDLTIKAAARAVHQQESEAGRAPPSEETILRIFYTEKQKPS
ncbi:MAG: hypothetical protein WAT23_18275 [Chromatiaceae bacterium]